MASQLIQHGTTKNHFQQASTFIRFYNHYQLSFIMPLLSTISCYITYLTQHFSNCNYISGVRCLHKELGLIPAALDAIPVVSLLLR